MKKEYTLILLSFLVFLYCLARVVGLSMTHDESATVVEFAVRPFWQVVTNEPPRANNHILNTLLIQFFTLFGKSKFFVRLPNLLAGGLYLYFSYRMVRATASGWLEYLLAFALLAFNQYLLEFFALGRGYGLSLGFMMGSLYYGLRFTETRMMRALVGSMALAALACYSNLAMLTFFVALAAMFNLSLLPPFRAIDWALWKKANGAIILFSLILFVLLFAPVRALLREEELYFGGTDGLLADTLTTLIQNYLGPVNYFGEETKNLFLAPVFILLLLAVSRNLFEGVQRREFSPGFFFAGLLALTALGQFLQHELLGTRYLIHRTALLYFPLLALTSFFLVKRAENWVKLALLLPIAIHFLNRANVEMVQEWWYDPYTE